MARLPTPGGDDNNWGDILNSFLDVSHNVDGTLQPAAIEQAGAVTSINALTPVNGALTFSTDDLSNTTISGPANNQVLAYNSGSNTWNNATVTNLGVAAVDDVATWIPSDSGFLTADFPPLLIAQAGNPVVTVPNNIILIRLPVRSTMTITNICIGLESAAGAAASSGTYVGIYDTTGTLLASSADIGTLLGDGANNQSLITAPMSSAVIVQPPWVYAALLINMTDAQQPSLYGTAPPMDFLSLNFGLTAASALFAYTPGTYSSLPATLDLSQNIFGSTVNCAFFAAAT